MDADRITDPRILLEGASIPYTSVKSIFGDRLEVKTKDIFIEIYWHKDCYKWVNRNAVGQVLTGGASDLLKFIGERIR